MLEHLALYRPPWALTTPGAYPRVEDYRPDRDIAQAWELLDGYVYAIDTYENREKLFGAPVACYLRNDTMTWTIDDAMRKHAERAAAQKRMRCYYVPWARAYQREHGTAPPPRLAQKWYERAVKLQREEHSEE